jgi:hypothetical protein
VSVERNLIISLLKLTKEASVLIESINMEARLPIETTENLLRKLQNEGMIK